MSDLALSLSRRHALGLLAASPLLLNAQAPLAQPLDYKALLQDALARADLPDPDADLTLLCFEQTAQGPGAQMSAVLRLRWPPGQRLRRVHADGDTPRMAFENLLARIGPSFGFAA